MTTKTRRRTKKVVPLPEQPEELLYTVEVPEGLNLEQPEEPKPYIPKMFEVFQLPEDGTENIPEGVRPFYVITNHGLYLNRNLLIGRGLIKQTVFPKNLKSLDKGDEGGVFWWKAPQIPADVCASIVHFFRRIYEKQKTEAEVILLMHRETMEWKVFIPTQKVSHGGVKSVYEPTDIPRGYIVVGTMHSHCDFGAFHSSTDTTDAGEFDGIHITIGHITREMPEIATMVMVNKKQFNYDDNIAIVADFSDLNAATAPEEWDEFVEVTKDAIPGHKPKGYELFEKYKEAPKAVVPWTPSTVPPQTSYPNYTRYPYPSAERDVQHRSSWDIDGDDWSLWDEYFNHKYPNPSNAKDDINDIIKKYDAVHWEEGLPDNITDAIMDSICLQEKDIDYAVENFMAGISMIHWRTLYMQKLADAVTVLNVLGLEVNYQVRPKKYTREENK